MIDFDEDYEEVNIRKTDNNITLDMIHEQVSHLHLLDEEGLISSVEAYEQIVELYNKYQIPFIKVKSREELMRHIDRLSYRILRMVECKCLNLTELNLNFLDVSEVDDFSYLFQGRTELRCLEC